MVTRCFIASAPSVVVRGAGVGPIQEGLVFRNFGTTGRLGVRMGGMRSSGFSVVVLLTGSIVWSAGVGAGGAGAGVLDT